MASPRTKAYRKFAKWREEKVRIRLEMHEMSVAEMGYAEAWLKELEGLQEPWDRPRRDHIVGRATQIQESRETRWRRALDLIGLFVRSKG